MIPAVLRGRLAATIDPEAGTTGVNDLTRMLAADQAAVRLLALLTSTRPEDQFVRQALAVAMETRCRHCGEAIEWVDAIDEWTHLVREDPEGTYHHCDPQSLPPRLGEEFDRRQDAANRAQDAYQAGTRRLMPHGRLRQLHARHRLAETLASMFDRYLVATPRSSR